MRSRWIYLIAIVPTVTEWVEAGRLPTSPREAVTDVVLTAILIVVAWLACRQHDEIERLATSDPLTGLFNTRRFRLDLDREVARAQRMCHPLSLAVVDLDGFKGINDRFGHAEGDAVLARFARLLSGGVRAKVDGCYRLGGDEFAVLLPEVVLGDATKGMERIRIEALQEPTGLARYAASLSIGIAELEASEAAEGFLRRADGRMYEAKQAGRNRVAT